MGCSSSSSAATVPVEVSAMEQCGSGAAGAEREDGFRRNGRDARAPVTAQPEQEDSLTPVGSTRSVVDAYFVQELSAAVGPGSASGWMAASAVASPASVLAASSRPSVSLSREAREQHPHSSRHAGGQRRGHVDAEAGGAAQAAALSVAESFFLEELDSAGLASGWLAETRKGGSGSASPFTQLRPSPPWMSSSDAPASIPETASIRHADSASTGRPDDISMLEPHHRTWLLFTDAAHLASFSNKNVRPCAPQADLKEKMYPIISAD